MRYLAQRSGNIDSLARLTMREGISLTRGMAPVLWRRPLRPEGKSICQGARALLFAPAAIAHIQASLGSQVLARVLMRTDRFRY